MAVKKKRKTRTWHVKYVDDSSEIIRSFATKRLLDDFVGKIKIKPEDGYWVDFTFHGVFLKFYPTVYVNDK